MLNLNTPAKGSDAGFLYNSELRRVLTRMFEKNKTCQDLEKRVAMERKRLEEAARKDSRQATSAAYTPATQHFQVGVARCERLLKKSACTRLEM